MKRLAAGLTAVLALLGALPAQAQPYPNKPIRIVVPFAAGGTSDILARAIGPRITEVPPAAKGTTIRIGLFG